MDFRHISMLHGQPDPLKTAHDASTMGPGTPHDQTVTIYKGTDEIAISVIRSLAQSPPDGDEKEIYLRVSTAPSDPEHRPGDTLISLGHSQQKYLLPAPTIEAMGMNPHYIIAVAEQLSASKITMKTPQQVPLFAWTAPSRRPEADIVAELGQLAVTLANKAAAPTMALA